MKTEALPARTREPLPRGYMVIWSTVVVDLIGFGIALPVLGPYARDRFGASGTQVGLLLSAFSAAQFVFAPLLGRMSDRFGRKPVLIGSLVGTALSSLLTGLAGTLWLLFVARLVDGMSGASTSVAQAAVADLAPPHRRTALLGMLGAAFGVGFTVGPAIGALATWLGNPRTPFFVAAALAALNAVIGLVRLPETRGDPAATDRAAPDRVGGSGGESTASDRLATTWRERGLPLLIGTAFGSVLAFSAFEGTFSIFGKARIGFTQATAALAFVIVGVMISAVQLGVVGRVVPAIGELRTLRLGYVLVAGGLTVLSITRSWVLLVPALALLCLGQGMASPTLTSSTVARIHPSSRGAVLGVQQSVASLARVLGPALGGLAFDHVDVAAPLLGAAAFTCACIVIVSAAQPGVAAPNAHRRRALIR